MPALRARTACDGVNVRKLLGSTRVIDSRALLDSGSLGCMGVIIFTSLVALESDGRAKPQAAAVALNRKRWPLR